MPPDGSWIDGLPGVGGASAPVAAAPAAGWMDAMPSVTTHPAGQPEPSAATSSHATVGPEDASSWLPSLSDVGHNLATGAIKGITGLANMLIPDPAQIPEFRGAGNSFRPTLQKTNDAIFNNITPEYVPSTEGGMLGQAATAGAVLAPITGGLGAIPAGAGAGAMGQLASDFAPEGYKTPALLLGGLAGASGVSRLANVGTAMAGLRAAAGGPLDPETAALAQTAQQHGIPLAPGQLSNNWLTRNVYDLGSKTPFSGSDAFAGAQQTALNRAVAGTFGETADRITPEVLSDARNRIGGMFNGVAARTSIPMGNDFLTDLQGVVNNARLTMSADSVAPVERQAMNMIDTAGNNGGNIGGRAYIDLTAKGGPLDTMIQSTDSGLRSAGMSLRNVIDNHLQANASPGDVAELQQARSQWKAMKTVEPLTLRADNVGGATPSTGDISAAALRGAVNKSYTNAAVAPLGRIPLNDLAKIGQRFLKEPKSSGTAERNMAGDLMTGAGALAATAFGGEHALGMSPLHSVAAMGSSMALNRLAQSVLRNQAIARQQIAGSLNPNGFRFGVPAIPVIGTAGMLAPPQAPFALTPPGNGP